MVEVNLEKIFSDREKINFIDLINLGSRECINNTQKDILFLGINPSYDGSESIHDKYEFKLKCNSYFTSMKEIMGDYSPEKNCAYTDLFYHRETDQAQLWSRMSDRNWIDFLCDQLAYTEVKIRTVIKPKVIVVMNSDACHFLGMERNDESKQNIWMGYQTKWVDKLGCYEVTGNNSDIKEIGVQQMYAEHAMYIIPSTFPKYQSKESKKRLNWHIRFVLNNGFNGDCL